MLYCYSCKLEEKRMISKAFQTMVTQMSEVFPKKFGITDSHGLVLASNGAEPSSDIIEDLIYTATNSEKTLFKNGYTVKAMSNKLSSIPDVSLRIFARLSFSLSVICVRFWK